jgi:hypothetical protein
LLCLAHLFQGDERATLEGIASKIDGAMAALRQFVVDEIALA